MQKPFLPQNDGKLPEGDTPTDPEISDTEREAQVLALVPQYVEELNKAFNSGPGELIETIKQKWTNEREKLGLRDTTNLFAWFLPEAGAFGAYDLDSETMEQSTPAVIYIRQLQIDDPELFAACVEAAQLRDDALKVWLKETSNGTNHTIPTRPEHVIANWRSDLRMTTAFNKMLTYPGANEELLDTLCL